MGANANAPTPSSGCAARHAPRPGQTTRSWSTSTTSRSWTGSRGSDGARAGPFAGDALREGTLSAREAARIGLEVLGALEAAHAAGHPAPRRDVEMYKRAVSHPGEGDFTERGREVAETAIANLDVDGT